MKEEYCTIYIGDRGHKERSGHRSESTMHVLTGHVTNSAWMSFFKNRAQNFFLPLATYKQ
jgi:4-hydroxy-3-methylbut-2-enyl diphosphate reductase IspH